jgi:hypothetical protein
MKVRTFLHDTHIDRNLGTSFLSALFLRDSWPLLGYWTSYVASVVCRVLRIDHTFKIANSVRMKVGGVSRKCHAAMLTGCNELGLIAVATTTKTKSHDDMRIPLEHVSRQGNTKTVVTDNPHGDSKFLKEMFGKSVQLLGDIFHHLQEFGKSVKGFSVNGCAAMKDLSKVLWLTVDGPDGSEDVTGSTGVTSKKRFITKPEHFAEGAQRVLRHALSKNVSINANRWHAACRRMAASFSNGYFEMPLIGSYVDTPGLGSVSTRGTNAEETFHRCLRTFVKGGQSCAVTLHALIVGFTAKYNMDKLSRLLGTRPGAVVIDFKLNNINRSLSDELGKLVDDPKAMAEMNKDNPLSDWHIIDPLEHSDNSFLGVLTWTKDSELIEENFLAAINKFDTAEDDEDCVDEVDKHEEEFQEMYREVRYMF